MIDPASLPASVVARDLLGRPKTYYRPEWPDQVTFRWSLAMGFVVPFFGMIALAALSERFWDDRPPWLRMRVDPNPDWVNGIAQMVIITVTVGCAIYAVVWVWWRLALLSYVKRVVDSRRYG